MVRAVPPAGEELISGSPNAALNTGWVYFRPFAVRRKVRRGYFTRGTSGGGFL
jgi:hypothetical protein